MSFRPPIKFSLQIGMAPYLSLKALTERGGKMTRRELNQILYKHHKSKNSARETILVLKLSGLITVDDIYITPRGQEIFAQAEKSLQKCSVPSNSPLR